jgi:hypothetical protein
MTREGMERVEQLTDQGMAVVLKLPQRSPAQVFAMFGPSS